MAEKRRDGFRELEEMYEGYQVNDRDGEKIGKVDDLFVDEGDSTEYIGVKMGFLGLNSTLIPMEICRVDETDQVITVAAEKDRVKDGPSFDDDEAITPDFERRVRDHYGLEALADTEDRSGYGDYYSDESSYEEGSYDEGSRREETHPGIAMGDTDSGEFREHGMREEGANEPESDLEDEDELRVQRTEEELRAGTREREAGKVNVRKRVRTDREEVRVPKRREEVSVERVPVDEEASGAQIGEDEVEVPVVEDEVVVEKKPVAKEEVRIRKDVVEDEEVVEEDVRKEEIEVDEDNPRR